MKNPAKILVVEDDKIIQKIYGNLLHVDEYELMFVPDGLSALAEAESFVPDLIILDLMLPGQNGIEVCREIRAHETLCHVPVIMITALNDNDSRLKGLEAGVDEFIGKPFNKHELRARIRNVTQLNRYRKLLNEQSKFQDVLETAPDGIVIIDPDGRLILANRTLIDMAQRSVTESIVGSDFFELLGPRCRKQSRKTLFETLEDPSKRVVLESDLLTDSGASLPVELSACFFIWEEQPSIQINIRDVSAKKSMEQQFLRMQRLQSIGTLAGGIAHDLCNAMTPIQLASDMALNCVEEGPATSYLKTINRSANRGISLIRQILSFARGTESEHRLLRPKYVAIEIERIIRDTFPQQIEITREFKQEIASIKGDATQLTQILMNLCVNARDAMPNGGRLKLGIRNETLREAVGLHGGTASPGDYVVMSVEDSGSGIPEDIVDKVFDPFFTTKELGKGTGLGLSSTLGLVQSHGGYLSLESTLGKGTRFTIYFPAAQDVSDDESEDSAGVLPTGKGQRVLVVDDDLEIRTMLGQLLSAHKFTPLLAEDGPEAVTLLARSTEAVSAAIVDQAMPVMDGYQTMRALRKMDPCLPVIVLGDIANEETTGDWIREWKLQYVTKPCSARSILEAIDEALDAGVPTVAKIPKPVTREMVAV